MTESAASPAPRLASLDLLRGIACILMAVDHVRVYSGLPAGGPAPAIFLTRWVTHFVAPAFCFLAGAGIWFLSRRLADTPALRRFLISRGLLLVLLEVTLIRFLWSFQLGTGFRLAGVIWMLGWCMVLLAAFVGLRATVVGWLGVAIVLGQSLFGLVGGLLPAALQPWWEFIHPAGADAALGFNVLYVIVPWVGVMMAGYGLGPLLERPEAERHRLMHRLGLGMTAGFVVLATLLALITAGAPTSGDAPLPLWMRILDQRKYPASVLFLLMTLGPMIALVPWAERARGVFWRAVGMFGRVPMWFYLMHLLVIHSFSVAVTLLRTGGAQWDWFATAPYTGIPEEGRWSLATLYLVWALAIVTLHPLCQFYAERKRRRPAAWMRYL